MQPPQEPQGGQPALPGYGAPPAAAQPPYAAYSAVPPYGYYDTPAMGTRRASAARVADLIVRDSEPRCSLASWLVIPFVGAVAAVVLGHIARREIRRSYGLKSGNGLALAGLIIGYIQIALSIVLLFVFLLLFLAFAFESPTS